MKELSLSEMSTIIEQHEKQSVETLALVKQQFAQERSLLKEQLIHCENHIAKL
jgi:DNA-binding transcriptional MerR regulator